MRTHAATLRATSRATRCCATTSCTVCLPLKLLRATLRATVAEVESVPTSATSRATVSPCIHHPQHCVQLRDAKGARKDASCVRAFKTPIVRCIMSNFFDIHTVGCFFLLNKIHFIALPQLIMTRKYSLSSILKKKQTNKQKEKQKKTKKKQNVVR